MDKNASAAYENIDITVSQNLHIARQLLEKLRDDAKPTLSTVEVTEYSSCRLPTKTKRTLPKVPPAMVRCPEDARSTMIPCTKKRQIEFPESKFRPTGFCETLEPLICVRDLKKSREVSLPDELFPPAYYKPADNKSVDLCNQRFSTLNSESTSDELISKQRFPPAKFIPSTKPTVTQSQLPMKFYSTNGKMKMLLSTNNNAASSDDSSQQLFPVIPKQLNSGREILTPRRNKFNALVTVGTYMLDISGIFNQSSLSGQNIEKVVINGNSYSVCQ